MLLPTLNRRSGMILGFKFSQNLFECMKHAETQLCVKHGQGKGDHSGKGEGSSDPTLAAGLLLDGLFYCTSAERLGMSNRLPPTGKRKGHLRVMRICM